MLYFLVKLSFIEGKTKRSSAHSEVYVGNDQEEQKDSSSKVKMLAVAQLTVPQFVAKENVPAKQHNVSSRRLPQSNGRASEEIHSVIRKRYRVHRCQYQYLVRRSFCQHNVRNGQGKECWRR